jgi:AcrR family transcriptional regulator
VRSCQEKVTGVCAGVERLTVYNHFPELAQLFSACQAHFLGGHPPPDISPGEAANMNGLDRLESALVRLYGWFRANEAMEQNIHRDRDLLPELDQLLRQSADPIWDRAAVDYSVLIAARPRAAAAVRSMIRVAFDFRTWQLVTRGGASDREAAQMLARAIGGVA